MTTRRHVAWGAALLLLAACGSAARTTPTGTPAADRSPATTRTASVAPPLQEPSPSDVTAVATVQLAEDPQAPVDDDLERLVREWVRYAVRGADWFPHGESITMAVGGRTVVAFDDVAAALSDRAIWRQCPAGWKVYGASSCPVDLLGPIRSSVVNDTVLLYSSTFDEVTCAPVRTGPLPSGRLVVLRPVPQWRTCATDFAIALVADRRGLLRHVDITLAAP